ncbi:hypothetical protein ACIPRD_07690 [Streptomyces sp. NPDC090108]|uniref:hypothetical protein n=1 Tax=Streptomyces sp. NPDC090108 TaxID=3365947 RepID=UPI003802B2A9
MTPPTPPSVPPPTTPPLGDALAQAVREVPGVAFLAPGLTHRLRAALDSTGGDRASCAGVRMTRSARTEPWKIDVRIVIRAQARALDVTRATRTAVTACLAGARPAEPAHVTVTVTGVV